MKTSPSLADIEDRVADELRALSEDSHSLFFRWTDEVLIYGIPRGGIPIAYMVRERLRLWAKQYLPVFSDGRGVGPSAIRITQDVTRANIICDDLVDSGRTRARAMERAPKGSLFLAPYDKQKDPALGWLVFPWEVSGGEDQSGEDIFVRLLQFVGEDPNRPGLRETPARMVKAWREWSCGYDEDPASILKCFEDGAERANELVIVHGIPVVSKCEHHLADIIGTAHVGYIPNGRIVGLSKLARLVEVFSRRLQVQERLTNQVADALMEHLAPLGAGVLIRAAHSCMSTRGVRVHGSMTTTSALRGVLFDRPDARAEFLALCQAAEGAR